MRIIRLALVALFAVLALSAAAAGSASAFHPLFLTQSGKELLVLAAVHRLSLLRAERAGQLGLVGCELLLFHGWVLHLSTLIHRVRILFESNCRLSVPALNEHKNCELVHVKPLLGELGLLNAGTSGASLHVVLLLAPSDGTEEFAELKCEGNNTKVKGVIVGEVPENNATGEKQINTPRSEIETKFETINKSTNEQAIQEIYLLGTLMTGQVLKVEGFLGGKASEEAPPTNVHAEGGATVEISTTKV